MTELKLVSDRTKSGSWTSTATTSSYAQFSSIGPEDAAMLRKFLAENEAPNVFPEPTDQISEDVDTLSGQSHNQPMTDITDYRNELKFRDESLRRELDLRQESFRSEQAIRDKALDEKFAGFLAVQAERDKRLDGSLTAIHDDISRLGSLKLSIWGAMFTGLAITLTVIGLGITSYQAGQTDRRPPVDAPRAEASQAPPVTPK